MAAADVRRVRRSPFPQGRELVSLGEGDRLVVTDDGDVHGDLQQLALGADHAVDGLDGDSGLAGDVANALADKGRSPAEDLAQVREFVAGAGTARFEGTSRSEWGEGTDEPGNTSIDVTRIEGSFQTPDRMHSIEDSGDYFDEVLMLPGAAYLRNADSRAGLEAEPWVYHPVPGDAEEPPVEMTTDLDAAGGVALGAASGFMGTFAAPFELDQVLTRVDGVRRVSPGVLEANTTMRELLPPEQVAAIEKSMAEMQAQLEAEEEDAEEDAEGTRSTVR